MENDKLNPIDVSTDQVTAVDTKLNSSAGFEAENNTGTKKVKKAFHRLAFLAIGLTTLLVMLLISGTFLILSGGENNPLATSLGLSGTGFSGLLYVALGILFASFSLGGLITGAVGIFKTMNTKPEDKKAKQKAVLLTITGIILVLVGIGGMIFSFSSISNSKIDSVAQEIIETNPAVTTGLTAPVSITFSAGNIPIDQNLFNIVAYNWSFGDGNSATGPVVTHNFTSKPASGIYTVNLKVSFQEIGNLGSELQEETFTRVVAIENEQVFATFTFTPEEGQAPLEVFFDASESKDPDGQIVKYEWDFNNDAIFDAEGVTTKHTFTSVGSFPVTLKVTDNNGESNSIEHIVVVKSDEIISGQLLNTPNDEILVPTRAYQFDASEIVSTEGTIVTYEWNFGDGNLKNGRRVTHSYSQEGVYEVSLNLADDAGNNRVIRKNYTVSQSASGLFAKFSTLPAATTNNSLTGSVPLRVSFDAGASSGGDIVDFQWDFNNDGTIDATGQTAEYVYTQTGTFTPTLTITSADNKTAKTNLTVQVGGAAFVARLVANPVSGIVPLTVNFDATSTSLPEGEKITAFRWDFGDGTPLLTEGPIITHRFNDVGTFTTKVTAVTDSNKNSTATVNVTVTSTPLKACFTMSRKVGPAPLTVNFNPQCSTGTVASYKWTFEGLQNSNERRPNATFTTPGTYQVELEVTDTRNNISTFVDSVTVE